MEQRKIKLPKYVEEILDIMEESGYAAYCVGGSVRDMCLGRVPEDYDVTTAAPPEAIKRLFPHTVDTGLMHGTVTVITEAGGVEVTTFRKDGAYTDRRRPDAVEFLPDISEDLARRDFTVNAMAYSPRRGFCDPFSGEADIKARCLRTVGVPRERFEEDALRILRLYRFAAQLKFSIEHETGEAAAKAAPLLTCVSGERIFAELTKLFICGTYTHLAAARPALGSVLPEADLSEKTLRAVAAAKTPAAKWARLLGERAEAALLRLHSPKALCRAVLEIAGYRAEEDVFYAAARLRYAAAADLFSYLGDDAAADVWAEKIKSGAPRSLRELAVTGRDVEEIGFRGKEIGECLERLLQYAVQNPKDNYKEKLREVIKTWRYKQSS